MVSGSCEHGGQPLGSGAMELLQKVLKHFLLCGQQK
jgi:hypothetical protein